MNEADDQSSAPSPSSARIPGTDSLPSSVGKYEVIGRIGRGGFGVVYKARDPFIKRPVAIKTCSSSDETVQQRFFREAEIAGNLHHPDIVTIHDFGVDEGTPYLVQEFLTGEDLDVLMESELCELDLQVKLHCLQAVARALHFAHEQGVIHRDVKPGNVRVLHNGAVKVMDFGIAKLKGEQSHLTRTGIALGTAAYLSPEQLRGDPIDHRADIFSFGVLAYELLTDRRPFAGDTVTTTFYNILHHETPSIPEGLSPDLRDLLFACLRKDPAQRPASFEEIGGLLDRAVEMEGFEEWDDPVSVFSGSERRITLLEQARSGFERGEIEEPRRLLEEAAREPAGVLGHVLVANLANELRTWELQRHYAAQRGQAVEPTTQIEASDSSAPAGRPWLAPLVVALLTVTIGGVWWWNQRSSSRAETRSAAAEPVMTPATSPGGESAVADPGARTIQQDSTDSTQDETSLQASASGSTQLSQQAAEAANTSDSPEPSGPSAPSELPGASPAPVPGAPDASTTASPLAESNGSGDAESSDRIDSSADESATPPGLRNANRDSDAVGQEARGAGDRERLEPSPPAGDEGDSPSASDAPSGTSGSSDPRESTTASSPPQEDTSSVAEDPIERAATAPELTSTATQPANSDPRGEDAPARRSQTVDTPLAEPEPEFDLQLVQLHNEIRAALDVWSAAWKSLDHRAIQRIHPSSGVERRDVRQWDTADVELRGCSYQVNAAQTSALAQCDVRRVLRERDEEPVVETFSGLRLALQNGRWIVLDLLP